MKDPFYILESRNVGYKVVYCPHGPPAGSGKTANYHTIADGLRRQEAEKFARRLRK